MLCAVSTPSSSVLTPNSSLMRHPDRGAGFYHSKRERFGRAGLVETGRYAVLLLTTSHSAESLLMLVMCTGTGPSTAASGCSATGGARY